MRLLSYLEEFDSYDSTYQPDDYSMYTGDSRMSSRARNSRPQDVVRHTEYHSNAERDFTKPYRPAAFAEKSKFITSIARAPFPVNAKIHTSVGKYNGAAREWFDKLPDGEISSWDDLVKKFSQQFSQQKKHTRDQSEILDVIRRDNESIEDFITRFNEESLNIGGISKDMLCGAFRKNVKCDDLFKFEFQTPRPNRQAKGPIWSRLQPSAEVSKPFDARSLIGNKNKAGPSNRGPNSWTPLLKTPAEILTTENVNFRKPQPLSRRSFLDAKKHCSYHDDIGHNTNECKALKNEIEVAVKSEKLGHLVKNGKPDNGKAPARDNQGPSKKQIKDLNVHMIQGGCKIGKKRRESDDEEWKYEPVIFPRIKGGPNNKNPLIITALFGHYNSHYVFFDTGSTSNIMYEQCFEQLDEDDKERLKPIHAPVSGFGGEIMHPRGDEKQLVTSMPIRLWLTVRLGSQPAPA
ncbi:uncharacterized protein LOC143554062 [Bidens hawaiensis]|uniref:uncharacterized protein LOC143554062 n=1 Tax=Bidens hawaiensis TaxID=980011 RepID=UPI004049E843